MKIKKSSRFLNPVLNSHIINGDYESGSFYIEDPLHKKDKEGNILVTIRNSLDQDDILKEIGNDKAKAYLTIQCASTYYRKCQEYKINEEIDNAECQNGEDNQERALKDLEVSMENLNIF